VEAQVIISDEAVEAIGGSILLGQGVRVSVRGGGCSGMEYHMEPAYPDDRKPTDKHLRFTLDSSYSLDVLVDARSWLFLEGVCLEHEGGLNGRGYVWSNPKAKRTCGCGSSFSA
jgi:iron-sulfur cluster assembly protein